MRRCRRKQKGVASASFDVGVMNGIERSHLVADVTDLTPDLDARAADVTPAIRDKHAEHEQHIVLRQWHARSSEQDAGGE
jgi:phosphoketolase